MWLKQAGLLGLPDGLFPVLGGALFCLVDDVDLCLISWLEDRLLASSLEVLLEVGRFGVLDLSREGRPARGPRCARS